MRNIVLFLSLTLFVYAQDRFCIEVLSTEDKKTITKEFMEKVSAMSLPHSLKYMKGTYKVFMGDFKTREEAESVLQEVHDKISKDAIISVVKELKKPLQLNANAKMQQAMLMAQAKMITKSPIEVKEKSDQQESSAEASVEISGPQDRAEARLNEGKEIKASQIKAQKQEDRSDKTLQEQFCKPTKKALREKEIAEALMFYKNSSFYKFTD